MATEKEKKTTTKKSTEKETTKKATDGSESIVKKCSSGISKTSSSVANEIKDVFEQTKGTIKSTVNEVDKAIDTINTKTKKLVKDNIPKFTNKKSSKDDTQDSSKKGRFIDFSGIIKGLDKIKNAVSNTSKRIKDSLNNAFSSIKSNKLYSSISNAFGKAKSAVSKFAGNVKPMLNKAFDSIKTSKLKNNVSKALDKAKGTVSKFSSRVRPMLNRAFDSIKAGKLSGDISNALGRAKGAVSKFVGKVRPTLNKAFDGIKAGKIYNNIVPALNKAKGAVSKFASKVGPTLSKAFSKINVKGIANGIEKGLKGATKVLGKLASGIGKGLNGAKKALSSFANASKSLWSKITGIFKKGSKDCEKSISPLKSSFSSLVGSLASMFGLYQLGSIFVDGTKQAMKYEASLMTIQRTLGGASKTLIDFANSNAQAFGINKSQVMEFGNIYSVIVSNFEKDATKAADITKGLLQSAGIIAGATGYDVNQVLENLRSGILGSSEAVDQLGLNLKTAQLAAAAGVKSWDDLTEAQKQAIIVQEILNQTTAKYGGIVKNTSSMHNAFMAQLSNTKLALGQLGKALYTAVLPALTTIMAALEKVFSFAAQVVTSLLSLFGITVDFSSSAQGIDSSVGDSLDDTAESAEDAKEAVEDFKGSLAGFDEINILSDNTSKNKEKEDTSTPGIGEIEPPDTSGAFDKIADKIKKFIDEILEPFKAAWDLLGDRWIAAWERLKEKFKEFCDSLAKFLKSVWENGKHFSAVVKLRKIGKTLIII